MVLPNFRKIYQDFRTPIEEKDYANAAMYKFIGFICVCVMITAARKASFPYLY